MRYWMKPTREGNKFGLIFKKNSNFDSLVVFVRFKAGLLLASVLH